MLRRRWKIVLGVVLLGSVGGAAVWWITREIPPISATIERDATRSRTLLAMAGRQTAKILDVDVRLTRLLNLADQEIGRGYKPEAREALSFAGQTLMSKDAASLDEQARISGWVSVSELSREAGDKSAASSACDGAVAALRGIEDPARRCEYVVGVCNELQYLKGKSFAASLLDEAGAWTRSIDNVRRRREAVTGFASALFNLDDYAAGERMIGREQDAAWGADTLTQLANMAQPASGGTVFAVSAPRMGIEGGLAGSIPAAAATPPVQSQGTMGAGADYRATFGKEVSYRYVFQNQSRPQTDGAKR